MPTSRIPVYGKQKSLVGKNAKRPHVHPARVEVPLPKVPGAEGALGPNGWSETIHPLARRLEKSTGTLLSSVPAEKQNRFKMITRSLAIPTAFLMDASSLDTRQKSKCEASFVETIQFLSTLPSEVDLDLDVIKFEVNRWFQRGVNDLTTPNGHRPLVPPLAVANALKGRALFRGLLHDLVKRHIAKANHRSAHSRSILASFLLSKRGWPQLGKPKLFAAVAGHQADMTREPPPVSVRLLDCVERSARMIFRKAEMTHLSPSTHASLTTPRSQGGAWADVVGTEFNVGGWDADAAFEIIFIESLKTRGLSGTYEEWAEFRDNRPSIKDPSVNRWIPWEEESMAHDLTRGGMPCLNNGYLRLLLPKLPPLPTEPPGFNFQRSWMQQIVQTAADFKSVHFDKTFKRSEEFPRYEVRVQPLPEPGKFRLITAGDSSLYTYLQPLQKLLLKQWAACPFSTMSPDWKTPISQFVTPDGWNWNSIDYDKATDQLNIHSTVRAVHTVCQILDIQVAHGLGISQNIINYDEKILDPEDPTLKRKVMQTNGQLMGHPLSFPLLCIINVAAMLSALDKAMRHHVITRDGRDLILHQFRVNGDDALFCGPPEFSPIFEECAYSLGLKPSLGKSYSSPDFAMINNVMFNVTANGLIEFSYLNQKLILNHSLKTGETEQSPLEIGHSFNRMFNLCRGSHRFLSDCIENRRRLLPIGGFEPNFFFPTTLGGYGIDARFNTNAAHHYQTDLNLQVKATRAQRLIAALCAEDQLSAFLLALGKNPRSAASKYLRMLPSVRARHQKKGTFGPAPFSETSGEGYRAWIGLLSLFDHKVDKPMRYVNWKKLGKGRSLQPMKLISIMEFDPKFDLPVIPQPIVPFHAHYHGTRSRRRKPLFPPTSLQPEPMKQLNFARETDAWGRPHLTSRPHRLTVADRGFPPPTAEELETNLLWRTASGESGVF
jgi:hypothetical protein